MDGQSSLTVSRPLLERKRRARINACLEELKELMVYWLEQEGGGAVRLEKADILEVTVRHMRRLKAARSLCVTPGTTYAHRFSTGFAACAAEVGSYLASPASGFDQQAAKVMVCRIGEFARTVESMASSPEGGEQMAPPIGALASAGPLDLSQPGQKQADPSWRPW